MRLRAGSDPFGRLDRRAAAFGRLAPRDRSGSGFFMTDDRTMMMRAISLAERGAGFTAPNPMVGAVVEKDGAIVGEGWHQGPGTLHAEPMALAAAGLAAKGSRVFVTLEPCNHYGRTPPCVDALLAAGVSEVIYAVADPNPVAAGGAARLAKAGVKVRAGVCEADARRLNRAWLHGLGAKRPFVAAKFAMSLDGKVATGAGDSKWITGPESRAEGHRLRQEADAILVGAGTVIADDPALTVRIPDIVPAHPLRVVIDSTGRTPPAAHVFDRIGRGAVLATTTRTPPSRRDAYRRIGVEVLALEPAHDGRVDLRELCANLKARGLLFALIEGGPELLGAAFDGGLVDEVHAFIAPVILGGAGKSAVAGRGVSRIADALALADVETLSLGADIAVRGRVPSRDRT